MVTPSKSPANSFVAAMRKVYNPIGFSKGYNFILWFIFAGALFGFVLARLQYLDIPGVFCDSSKAPNSAAPGECYYYTKFNVERIGIRLHLYCILPAGLLVPLQFVPAIRHKVILLHRMLGYTIILLAVVANAGALMIARNAFGGTLSTQAFVGTTVIATTVGLFLAIYNIKRLQIDQHRAWMLRTWFYFASIITLRLIMIITATIISKYGDYYYAWPCAKINFVLNSEKLVTKDYPSCAAFYDGSNPSARTLVNANMKGSAVEVATALGVAFGMASWIALALHAVGVEIYLHLTPAESQRLRDVSYQRQMEAGHRNPGNSGLTVQKLGDARPYVPFTKGSVSSDTSDEKPCF